MRGREASISDRDTAVVARPALFERLSAGVASGLTLISAPAGSGKSVLTRSWVEDAGATARTAWVQVQPGEASAQAFWLSIVERLRTAIGGDGFVEGLAPAPTFDGDAVVLRLVADLGSLSEPVILVIDDLQELVSIEAQRQLETLLMQRPPLLRVILGTRHDPQLGLHRLRLSGQLTELRATDLRFTLPEARELFAAAGLTLSDEAVATLVARTEGWAAGLRLAALSIARHPDPQRFIAAFSGSDRTVADYLLAEVLERQPAEVRRLLLRTSILERVSGSLADRLLDAVGSERRLLELEQANAFVVAVDADRSWFRYHQLFADLLRLELRRTDPDAIPGLHRLAAGWYAERGLVLDAVRHALAAEEWALASRLLADGGFGLSLDGHGATLRFLLQALPQDALADPELVAFLAYLDLTQNSLETAAGYIRLAERHASTVSPERQYRFGVTLAVARLALARQRGDPASALEEMGALREPIEAETVSGLTLSNDAKAVAFMNLGIVELWAFRLDDAQRHLEHGSALAHQIGRPYVEIGCLAHLALLAARRSLATARRDGLEAIRIAEAHGWASDPVVCPALATMAAAEVAQGHVDDGVDWLDRAERGMRPELEPATALLVHWVRGELHVGAGRLQAAIEEFRSAERLQEALATPHLLTGPARVSIALVQLRMGEQARARATLAELTDADLASGEARAAVAALRLAEDDPQAATEVVAPVLDGTAPVIRVGTLIQASLLDAIARDRLGDVAAATRDVERALDLAEPDALVYPFLVAPVRDLLLRHPRHETAHAALLADLVDILAGSAVRIRRGDPETLAIELSERERKVLRYLPSNLSASEIAAELYVSTSTVKTHMRHIYDKLDAHRRTEAVDRARDLGLLGPSARALR